MRALFWVSTLLSWVFFILALATAIMADKVALLYLVGLILLTNVREWTLDRHLS